MAELMEHHVNILVKEGGVNVVPWRPTLHQGDTIKWTCNRLFYIIPKPPWIFEGPSPPIQVNPVLWVVESGPMMPDAPNGVFEYGISVAPIQQQEGLYAEPEYKQAIYIDPEYRKVP